MAARIKAALAAATGAALLLGGAGTLAYWNDVETAPGTRLDDGELRLAALSCAGWKLDGETTVYDPTTQAISPGDSLTQSCTSTISAVGEHLSASLSLEAATWVAGGSAALEAALTRTATFAVGAGTQGSSAVTVTDADHGSTVTVVLRIDFPFGTAVDNTTNDTVLATTLDGVDLALTQTDSH